MKRIIAIDDEEGVLEFYQRSLHKRGYAIVTTVQPAAGLELIKAQPPDLIILDINMPDMTGFELFQELKQTLRTIPVLFATGYPTMFNAKLKAVAEMWARDFADGNTDVIYKPFDAERLYGKVEGLIGAAQEAS